VKFKVIIEKRKGFQRQPEAFPKKLKFLFINFNSFVILFSLNLLFKKFRQKEANDYRED